MLRGQRRHAVSYQYCVPRISVAVYVRNGMQKMLNLREMAFIFMFPVRILS